LVTSMGTYELILTDIRNTNSGATPFCQFDLRLLSRD
jgi:hypothetical protein